MAHPDTEAAARALLDQDAFALALRLYVVVTVLVILLALAGLAANLAVQLPSRRRDAASLRVVGVKRRSVMVGVVAEFVLVLGAAALAGIAAGGVAQLGRRPHRHAGLRRLRADPAGAPVVRPQHRLSRSGSW